jgi:hypothetical protein
MANKDAAFGLKAIGKTGQNRDNQGLSEYSIAANETAIYQWDPVAGEAGGTVAVAAAGGTLIGSLNGVFFTDASTGKPTFANHLAASNAATDIVGYVSDDPYERFEIQCDGAFTATSIFSNVDITYAAGSSPNYVSKVEADISTGTTATAQLRIVGVSKDPENNDSSATDVNAIVQINEHLLKSTTGV